MDRHRHHGDEGVLRQFVPVLQILTQCPGAERENHVVDLDAVTVLDGFDLREIELAERDVAVTGDRAVERGPRRGERSRHRFTLSRTRHPLREHGDSARDQTGNSCGPGDDGHESADRDVQRSRVARTLCCGIHERR